MPREWLERYFVAHERGSSRRQVGEAVRAMVSFEPRGLGEGDDEGEIFDAIFLGTPLFPLVDAAQSRAWAVLESKLAPGAWLYAGRSERVRGPASWRLSRAEAGVYRRSRSSSDHVEEAREAVSLAG